ncbi:MAG: hypothetical protein ACP5OA_05115, partial [Candidatus Woesearchaeota archaeon]
MSWRKNLLITGLVTIISVNTGLGQDQNKIKVEMGSGTRYFVSQKQAEKALARLSKTAEKEDSWIYYNDSLIDDGRNETSETVMTHIPLIIKTSSGDTIKVKINDGDTVTSYHNHTRRAPPSIFDMVNHSMLIDSIYTNKHVISKVADNGKMWEFSLEEGLMFELHEKNVQERFEILESRINKAYNKKCKYFSANT